MPIKRGTNDIKKIFRGTTEIVKAFRGEDLIFQLGGDVYELIADVNVTTTTTQIDFDNLNITKDDELRLVYTFTNALGSDSDIRIFINNNTTQSNYYYQTLQGIESGITVGRFNNSALVLFMRSNRREQGFADIKISNNDRFVMQSQFVRQLGSNSNDVENWNLNTIGTSSVTSITKISIVGTQTNSIGVGTKLTLYKVVK